MKSSPYSPDLFMGEIYDKVCAKPYENINTAEDALKAGEEIRRKAEKVFGLDRIPDKISDYKLVSAGKALDYPEYTLQKYSVEICKGLNSLVYMLVPKKIKENAPGVVALCGHGYGVRQILKISKRGNKKLFNYFDNYQKNFAVELAKRGCIVIAPELFGFGEARLKKDLIKPFYISSCDELSHHLLPYGFTVASMRIYQAIVCAEILLKQKNIDKEKLSCMGISGGGLTALYASVLDERFRKTVVSGYVNTFRDSILSLWHCPDNYIPGILEIGEIYDFASSIAPRELLIESGKKDKLFPIDASMKAHENIKRVYSLIGAEDKLHIDIFNGKHSVSGRKAFDFLAE
ncbi:MAG: acetylxylan esterase [Clostridia bacterium]|nr:acetylxylan esterase [Clostridia bacterium]